MDIVVLAGGTSDESEVSLSSGSQITNALISKGHRALLIDLSEDTINVNSFETAYQNYKKDFYQYKIGDIPPVKEKIQTTINTNILDICKSADIVFIALHGGIGENGQLQALFDIYGIQYTGSDYRSSLLAMDKIISKQLFTFHGFDTPEGEILRSINDTKKNFSFPVVIKPNDNGSSIGIEIANSSKEFQKSIITAFSHSPSSTVIVEKKIIGREFSVGILDERPLPVIELIPKDGFYDYKNKYQDNMTLEITPAQISEELKSVLQTQSINIHKALGLSVYSRVDFIVEDFTNKPYVIEANSLPGMTPNSLLPKEAHAAGISYADLCNEIIQISLKKTKNI